MINIEVELMDIAVTFLGIEGATSMIVQNYVHVACRIPGIPPLI